MALYSESKKISNYFYGVVTTLIISFLIYLIKGEINLQQISFYFVCAIFGNMLAVTIVTLVGSHANSKNVIKTSDEPVVLTRLQKISIGFLNELEETNAPAQKITISTGLSYKFVKFSDLLYSSKSQKEIFKPIAADWQEEYFEALFKKEIWKARWINVRYTYAFLAAMWQKSPIGDLIEFISKLAK